jgi:hypothetical protein
MEINEDFFLDYGQRLILKKPSGYSIIEYIRHPDRDLDNIIEVWHYDSRKKSKGDSVWIIEKDLFNNVNSHKSQYTEAMVETITQKSNKK